MSLATVADSLINKQSQEVLQKFQWAIKRVVKEHGTDDPGTTLTQDELIELIRVWEPQRDIICLYVRWARQLRRNFNLDSIATLLCLSRQCGYTPIDFLSKVKTLSVQKNQKAAYGVTFHFNIPNRNDNERERLNKEFLGLSVTLSLLQEQVTESPSILGTTGMRHKIPRTSNPMDIAVDGPSNTHHATIVTQPNVEFHTQSSLLNRIWISISHRWLALYLTEHLFREPNVPWSYLDALVYSFQMMASCGPGRYDFLNPLAGYCLRFCNSETIETKRTRLRELWKDPSSFMSYGNSCLSQYSIDAQSRIVIACFQELQTNLPYKHLTYNRDCSWIRRWTILRAYIFHFWLESASNSSMKSRIINEISANSGTKKRKIKTNDKKAQASLKTCTTLDTAQDEVTTKPSKVQRHQEISRSNGLKSITSSRRANIPSPSNLDDQIDATNESQSNHDATVDDKKATGKTLIIPNWHSFRLISLEEMHRYVQSYLLIHRLDGVNVLSELSPLEVYSANCLHDLRHCRLSGKSPFFPRQNIGPVTLHIRSEADCFLDVSAKSFHVSREQSENFLEHSHILPSMDQVMKLCQAIVSHGKIDSKRAIGQYRLNFGNGGQNWINSAPCRLHGMGFQKDLDGDPQFNSTEILQSIGQIVEFTWRVICGLQNDASDHPIAPDTFRKKLYAAHLNKYLKMDQDVGFEDVTLVVSSLHPVTHQVREHKDTMNDTIAGYTRTGAFNMVMIDDKDDCPTIIHFQVLGNFRRVIGHYVVPFHNFLPSIVNHACQYLDKWHRSIQSVYAGRSEKIPTVFDRRPFFLDDTLEYTTINIAEAGKHKQTISSQYILTEVGISRTLSLSMFIGPIVKLQRILKFDQTIELVLACSFLSNPFWFDWTMSALINRIDDPNDSYQLGLHPFYDWSHCTYEIFGSWQGGPYNRWSPCGGNRESVMETFGAQPNAKKEDRENGERKLSQVVRILWEHIEWVNSLSDLGNNPVIDMPLESMKAMCNRTIREISNVASCQFSHFRLGIFTTILAGCGLLQKGKHLRHLMYPVKGSASFKHLSCPVADIMSQERAHALGINKENESISNDGEGVVKEDHHDLCMQYLSSELAFPVYLRDEIECILCESHPMRSLNCRDWFRKGSTLFDCNMDGEFFCRPYGRETTWEKLLPPKHYHFAYLTSLLIMYVPLDSELSYQVLDFGKELRSSGKLRFKGRQSRTSHHNLTFTNNYNTGKEMFPHPSMQVADFIVATQTKRRKLKSIFVLGDAEHAVTRDQCNNLDDFRLGRHIHKHLQSKHFGNNELSHTIAAGCYHMDSESSNDEVTFFPGHIDKPFVHTVWFVPLATTPFFTVLSVPSCSEYSQDPESIKYFEEWKSRLNTQDSKKVDDFLKEFDSQAQKQMKVPGHHQLKRLIYLNKCGSILSFPANQCYHASIIPKKPKGFPRDLFIFHPLDGLS